MFGLDLRLAIVFVFLLCRRSRAHEAYSVSFRKVGYPSGQRGQTVNLLALPSQVRILFLPPLFTGVFQKHLNSAQIPHRKR